jgi:hypothetical protein
MSMYPNSWELCNIHFRHVRTHKLSHIVYDTEKLITDMTVYYIIRVAVVVIGHCWLCLCYLGGAPFLIISKEQQKKINNGGTKIILVVAVVSMTAAKSHCCEHIDKWTRQVHTHTHTYKSRPQATPPSCYFFQCLHPTDYVAVWFRAPGKPPTVPIHW